MRSEAALGRSRKTFYTSVVLHIESPQPFNRPRARCFRILMSRMCPKSRPGAHLAHYKALDPEMVVVAPAEESVLVFAQCGGL